MTDGPDPKAKGDAAKRGGTGGAAQPDGEARDVSSGPNRQRTMHPIAELTLTRVREFVREPEVIFWVFIFPVLLACALGLAFRNTVPERIRIAVEDDGQTGAMAQTIAALEKSADVVPVVLGPTEAARALQTGNVALVVRADRSPVSSDLRSQVSSDPRSQISDLRSQISNSFPPLVYRYDPTSPDSRTARLAVDHALAGAQHTANGSNPREERVIEPGARYIDFLIPGLIGLNLMGSGMWGLGFAIVSARSKKLLCSKHFSSRPISANACPIRAVAMLHQSIEPVTPAVRAVGPALLRFVNGLCPTMKKRSEKIAGQNGPTMPTATAGVWPLARLAGLAG